MQNEPITHDVNHPVSASAGPDNAYYLKHCAAIERGPSYAACLARLHDIEGGRVNERTAQCDKAVREGRCVASGMREQEKLAGVALFYFPRLNKPFLPVSVAGDFGVLITNLTDPALIPKPPRPFGEKVVSKGQAKSTHELQVELATDVLGKAIENAALQANAGMEREDWDLSTKPITVDQLHEEIKKNPPVVNLLPKALPASDSTKIQPGETPLQYARRMAALRNTKQE